MVSDGIDLVIESVIKIMMMLVLHDTYFNLSDHLSPFIQRQFKESLNLAKVYL